VLDLKTRHSEWLRTRTNNSTQRKKLDSKLALAQAYANEAAAELNTLKKQQIFNKG
jgi:hypothetical protein